MLKSGESRPLPPVNESSGRQYVDRYLTFFGRDCLRSRRLVFFQHSAVGRDLLVDLLQQLGAEVHAVERSDQFIPIDTEDISEQRLADLQRMADHISEQYGPVDAVVSTDGDSDRPLLCGVDNRQQVHFYGGDLLGLLVADFLEADSVSVPISSNDAVDIQLAKRGITARKTKIGSPYVIKAMQDAQAEGSQRRIVGWEANGGFLTGSTIQRQGRTLQPLPTRDAALPLISALVCSVARQRSLVDLFADLPPRFSKAGLIDQFPQSASRQILQRFAPAGSEVQQVDFQAGSAELQFADGHVETANGELALRFLQVRSDLERFFSPELGFQEVVRVNWIDGVRICFANGDVAHVRPSGNAPQLRIYAVANSQQRADQIVQDALAEPDGVLRTLEKAVS
jgi:phosphomannomutase